MRPAAALLHLNVIGEAEDVFLHRPEAHEAVQLFFDLLHRAGVGGGQQVEKLLRFAAVEGEVDAPLPGGQGHRAGEGRVGLQTILAQGAEHPVTAGGQPRHALLRAALVGHIVPHVRPCRESQPEAGFHLRGQRVELLGRQRGEVFPGKGGRLADIAQRRDEGRTEPVGQRRPALPGKEDEVLAAGGDAAHRPGGKGGPGIHQNALLVDEIPAGQGRTAPDGEVGQRL